MPGEVNCIFTKVLIPFLEREVGPDAGAAVCRAAGRPREWLMADHNWISLALANELIELGQALMGEPDTERWTRRFWEYGMDWKPREERSYIGTYTMGFGDPRSVYARQDVFHQQVHRWVRMDLVEIGRTRAVFRRTPLPGYVMPRWACTWVKVTFERFPTNWGLPRAQITESQCAADGADACVLDVRWRNPSLGLWFWTSVAAGAVSAAVLSLALAGSSVTSWAAHGAVVVSSLLAGLGLGFGLREHRRRGHTQRLLDLQGEEIIYSNNELETKFRDLETKIEQLSLLIELSAAVNAAALDPEKIYEQAVDSLMNRMRYEGVYIFSAHAEDRVLRTLKFASGSTLRPIPADGLTLPMTIDGSAAGKAAVTGLAVVVNDLDATTEPFHRASVEALGVRALVAVPLRVKTRVFGALVIHATMPGRFSDADVDLIAAVANHVALAVDRAESFQTIEELSRGLEEKVRVRTEELAAAYHNLQRTQMQLVQREKMASVGQLVAGVAHELNNPIGFVFSNVSTLEDFVRRLREMVETYRRLELPAADRERVEARWNELKVDYALRYLDSMMQGIREGAERTRKIVGDLRVFARTPDDVWQTIDVHEELESSLTLLNHLLKDRVVVERAYGALPPVECIRSQIDQVFLNLLANAAQAIVGPGRITIETGRENEMAVVKITDTGPGVPAEAIDRVFDPFFTTKPVGEGTGLGLSISYQIVKKHGGEIVVSSPPGGGATFVVLIPVARKV